MTMTVRCPDCGGDNITAMLPIAMPINEARESFEVDTSDLEEKGWGVGEAIRNAGDSMAFCNNTSCDYEALLRDFRQEQ